MAAGASGDLRQFGRGQPTEHGAVELAGRCEGDVVDLHVEAHADGVGGDQKVDVARLVEFHLCIAGARAERSHDDSRAAALTADQFGDRINLVGAETHDGAARWQPGDLLLARVGQFREPRPRDEMGAGEQLLAQGAHGAGAEHHGLGLAAPVQKTVGENVAAFKVGGELHFVDGEKVDLNVVRHGLDGTDIVARFRRDDLLLASDQGGGVLAGALDHLVVHFARQQPQRQPDHSGFVAEHALHREMGLAGVGGAQDDRHVACARMGRSRRCG